jgi:RNA polymerase sigma factor (sigma-70 family)
MTAGEHEPETSGPPSSHRDAPQRKVTPALADIRAEWIDFYDANYHRVVRFIMHAGACLQSAQDAAQEAFTESWALIESNPQQWLTISSKEAWIRVVALRRYRRPPGPRIRPTLAEGAAIPDLPDSAPGPCELTAQTQMVLQALCSLDEQARAVMAFHLDDFPGPAIADALNLTEQRVRDVKKKARVALRIALAAQMPPEGRQPR